jgi:hypothetical protein
MKVIDAVGNPIVVRGLLEYCVEDAATLHIATNDSACNVQCARARAPCPCHALCRPCCLVGYCRHPSRVWPFGCVTVTATASAGAWAL